jgi:type IV pilus assembly protein PilO
MNYEMLRDIIAARRKSFVLIAVLVLVNLALLLFLSLWQEPTLQRTQSDWFAKRDAAARGVDRGVSARYRDAEQGLAEFQKRLIDKKDFAAFLSDLFAMARSNSLVLKGITYKPTLTKQPGLTSYVIGFNLSGKYAGAKSFLADLVRYPKMVTLDAITLANGSQTEEAVDLKITLTVFLKMEGA